jgi:hypothetical protein
MAAQPTRFKLDEEIALSGKPLRVAGFLQFEGDGAVSTRYFLAGAGGGLQILEDLGGRMALLRPFPASSLPEASGDTVSVMGTKYKLSVVRKLKRVGSVGSVPGDGDVPLVLSGVFEGATGALLREMRPGAAAQSYYAVKAVDPAEVLDSAALQAQARAAEAQARAAAEEDEPAEKGGFLKKAVNFIVVVLVLIGLAWACSDESGDSSPGGSARSSFHVSSGGK